MPQVAAIDFTVVEQPQSHRSAQKEQIVAAWRRLRSLYRRTEGPKIFAGYYAGAFDRANAAAPVVSFRQFTS